MNLNIHNVKKIELTATHSLGDPTVEEDLNSNGRSVRDLKITDENDVTFEITLFGTKKSLGVEVC